jgi:GntR family transcriptional regulator, arabinose operon transcriptional repressor
MPKKLLYQEIIDYLKAKIAKQEFLPGDLLPSEFELARDFKVSRITAQKALDELENSGLVYRVRGKGSFVSERAQISQGNPPKQSLKVIALVIPFKSSLGRSFDVIQGLSALLSKNGYYLSVHISHYSIEEEREILIKLVQDGVAGIIIYPFSHRDNLDLIHRFLLNNYPIITIDKFYDVLPVSGVFSDNFDGSYKAATHLIERGHRNIVFISDRELAAANSVSERYFGFCKALKDHNLPITDQQLILTEYRHNEPLFEAVKNNTPSVNALLDPYKTIIADLLEREIPCTAIHGLNDYLTIFLLKAALAMGVNVPHELSFIGFDNIDYSAYIEVPLTTVEQNFKKIGEEAGNLIMNRMISPDGECRRVVIPVDLIERQSTASLKTVINY